MTRVIPRCISGQVTLLLLILWWLSVVIGIKFQTSPVAVKSLLLAFGHCIPPKEPLTQGLYVVPLPGCCSPTKPVLLTLYLSFWSPVPFSHRSFPITTSPLVLKSGPPLHFIIASFTFPSLYLQVIITCLFDYLFNVCLSQ